MSSKEGLLIYVTALGLIALTIVVINLQNRVGTLEKKSHDGRTKVFALSISHSSRILGLENGFI